ncbi:uncharacterized protein LOC122790548 [Protopterus annectens]|uniref:uncharacterized protein LOC122790548 n=1 Tax=Protopterus annectens TaxID=7888 RepID=UPI001CFA0C0C|nr:uncharacterized protein LOC122790548 [Protopterus annectens]
MQPKVLQSLKCALQSSVKDITVKWQLPFGVNASLLSKAPLVMFKNQRSIIYAQLKGKLNKKADGHASVKYTFEDEKFKETLQFRLEPDKNSRLTVHHLAAKSMIKELEEEHHENSDVVKKKVTAVSLQAGIISSHTAFVAVNKELNQPIKGPLIRRDIPLRGIVVVKKTAELEDKKKAIKRTVTWLKVIKLESLSLGRLPTKSALNSSSQLNVFALKSCSLGQVETKSAPKRSSQLNAFALKSCSLGQVETKSAPKRSSQLNANESKSFSLRPIRTKSAPNSSSQLNEKSHTFMDLDLLLRGEVFPEAASDPCARSIPYERASGHLQVCLPGMSIHEDPPFTGAENWVIVDGFRQHGAFLLERGREVRVSLDSFLVDVACV